jgi:hypothetical protein
VRILGPAGHDGHLGGAEGPPDGGAPIDRLGPDALTRYIAAGPCALRSDTPACFCQEGVWNSYSITDLAGEEARPSAVGGRTLSVRPEE